MWLVELLIAAAIGFLLGSYLTYQRFFGNLINVSRELYNLEIDYRQLAIEKGVEIPEEPTIEQIERPRKRLIPYLNRANIGKES